MSEIQGLSAYASLEVALYERLVATEGVVGAAVAHGQSAATWRLPLRELPASSRQVPDGPHVTDSLTLDHFPPPQPWPHASFVSFFFPRTFPHAVNYA